MFGDGLGHAVKYAFQIINLPRVLHLHEYDFAFAVLGFDVHAVELVGLGQLVPFTFQYFHDLRLVLEEHCEQSFQHGEVGLVAQQPLDGPVESYVSVFELAHKIFILGYYANTKKRNYRKKSK